jgi:hypothetical protein
MTLRRHHLSVFFVAAIACFVIALLITTGEITSTREGAWQVGGLLSLSLGLMGR